MNPGPVHGCKHGLPPLKRFCQGNGKQVPVFNGHGPAQPGPAPGVQYPDFIVMISGLEAGISMEAVTCKSSVDLPMPGSPPSRMTPPGTNPLPRIPSSPDSCELTRSSRSVGIFVC